MKIGLQTWGSEGDVQPFITLAGGLVRAGHEVTLVVTDNIGRDYSGQAKKFGFHLVEVRNPDSPSAEEFEKVWRKIIEVGNPIRQSELVLKYGFDPAMEAMFVAAKNLCATNDAVVGHFFLYPLRVAAEKSGTPIATINVFHNCLPSSEISPPGLPDIGKWFYPLGWKLVRSMVNRIFLPRVNALRKREGLTPDSDVMTQTWASKTLNLVIVSPTICHTPKDWGSKHDVCGFLNPPEDHSIEELPKDLEEFIAAGEPPVYFTFGSMMLHDLNYIKEALDIWIETVRKVGVRAIFQLPYDDLSVFKTDDKIFKVKRAPYKKIFPKCSLIIHHGGAGTTQSSIRAGRPSVVVAHMADQFFWGAELERLGVAGRTHTRKGLTPHKLAKSIKQVLASPEMSKRAKEIGAIMSKENGTDAAVRLIETRLTGK
ncbi:MAG: glycosyltransferase [Nitrosomonadales bacterium]